MYITVLVFSFKIYSNEFYSIIKILNTTFLSFTTLKSKIYSTIKFKSWQFYYRLLHITFKGNLNITGSEVD